MHSTASSIFYFFCKIQIKEQTHNAIFNAMLHATSQKLERTVRFVERHVTKVGLVSIFLLHCMQRRTGGHMVRSSFRKVAYKIASCVRTFNDHHIHEKCK